MSTPIQIKWADGEAERLGIKPNANPKLFIGSLPKDCSEVFLIFNQKSQIREIFEPFGEIKELHMMKDRDGSLRGFAFLKFHLKEPALLAIRKLNGQTYLPNCDKPIEVRFADNRTGLEQTYSAPSTKPINEPSSPVYPK